MEGALIVNRRWGAERIECCMINVYAPSSTSERINLWDRIQQVIEQNSLSCICVGGDFNAIRRGAERVGRRMEISNRDIEAYDYFIRESELIDLPLHGRGFTCYRPDGSCKSRIDRILLKTDGYPIGQTLLS